MSFAPFISKKQAQRAEEIFTKIIQKNEARAPVLYTTMNWVLFFPPEVKFPLLAI